METEGTPTQDTTEPTEATEESSPDFSPLYERFDKLESQMGDRIGALEQSLAAPPEEQYVDEYGQPVDPYGQPDYDDDGYQDEPQGLDPQQLAQLVQQQVEQRLSPIQAKMLDQELAALEDQYPKLREPETANRIVQLARQEAGRYGNPELAENPDFIERMYLSEMARERAEQETPADAEQEAQLETGGATPQEPERGPLDNLMTQDPLAQFWGVR